METNKWRGRLESSNVFEFQERVRLWNEYNFPNKKLADRPSDQPLKGIVEELGELAHADLKEQQGIRGTKAELDEEAKDALGDMLVYMADYATQRGWSLADCMAKAWNDIRERDWIHFPKNGRTE